ncbi:MAG: hypothetical protein IIB95_06475 [Candidatus Marinimicrobia bacterium]|nr:hypothetical protein [Candidatus Neomarinimicrobiota bacterium]
MSDCCSVSHTETKSTEIKCPSCDQKGKQVDLLTIRSITRRDFPHYGELTKGFLCLNPDDATVYYFSNLDFIVNQDDVVTDIGFKTNSNTKTVCYCFRHTKHDIIDDYLKHGKSNIENDVRQKVKDKQCTCEVSNPKGKCCLGDIRTVIKGVEENG